jgi:hypothetical protein
VPKDTLLIQFSLGNLLDIILVCSLASYFDGLLYHFFVKKIITENENLVEYNITYYSQERSNFNENEFDFGAEIISYSSKNHLLFPIGNSTSKTQAKLSLSFALQFFTNSWEESPSKGNLHKSLIHNIVNSSLIFSFSSSPLNNVLFNDSSPSNLSLNAPIATYIIFKPSFSFKKHNYCVFLVQHHAFYIIFVSKIHDLLPFYHQYHIHTIHPDYRGVRRNLEYYFTYMCGISFLIAQGYEIEMGNGIKQFILNLNTKSLEDLH